MSIIVENSKLNDSREVGSGNSGAALDQMWEMSWIKSSMLTGKNEIADRADDIAGQLRAKSDTIVVVSGGVVRHLISAVIEGLKPADDRREIIVTGETISAADFAALAAKLGKGNFSLIAVANEDETPSQMAAYVFIRKLLSERYGTRGAASRTVIVASGKNRFIAEDGVNNGIEPIMLAEDAQAVYSGNTMALLLPIMAAGIDGHAYMDGFREMIADTWWDADGDEFSLSLAGAAKKGGKTEEILIWQRELSAFGDFAAELHRRCGIETVKIMMPEQRQSLNGQAYRTLFLLEKEARDVMLPVFPECGPEGSLNAMLQAAADDCFNESGGTKIMLEEMTSYDFGRFVAFVQISAGITSFILNN